MALVRTECSCSQRWFGTEKPRRKRRKQWACWVSRELIVKNFAFCRKKLWSSPKRTGTAIRVLEVTLSFVSSSGNDEEGTDSEVMSRKIVRVLVINWMVWVSKTRGSNKGFLILDLCNSVNAIDNNTSKIKKKYHMDAPTQICIKQK